MEERLQILYPIIVEGKYDKLRLESVVDANIITTDGFGVFNADEKRLMLRTLAKKTPLILLTDSDGAGKLIRSYLTSILPPERIIQLYVPRIKGKEKRKQEASREGVLGVEGMERALLRELLMPYADADSCERHRRENPLSKTDLYIDGLTGGEDSRVRRDALAVSLGLPEGMTPNALLAALKIICTYDEYCIAVGRKKEDADEA